MTSIDEDIKKEPLARSKIACTDCRSNKVRCIRGPVSDGACARCVRFDLACSDPLVKKKRGRPPHSQGRQSTSGPSDSHSPDNSREPQHFSLPSMSNQPFDSHPHQARDRSSPTLALPDQYSHPFALPSIFGDLPQTQAQAQAQLRGIAGPSRPAGLPYAPSLPLANQATYDPTSSALDLGLDPDPGPGPFFHPSYPPLRPQPPPQPANSNVSPWSAHTASTPRESQSNLDLSEFLDPADRVRPQAPFFQNMPSAGNREGGRSAVVPEGERIGGDDPVALLILSHVEASSLVQLFHERLNPHVAVLDRQLHTMKYLRRTSTVLFTSILAASSRFFRKDLHPVLLSHAQTILDRAVTAGASDIGMVQSLMILTYWKSPADTSAWRKSGIAIRTGYQLYWHIQRREALPPDEASARLILNGERAWYCLFCFDRGFAQTFGLPTAIRLSEIGNAESWARDHLSLGPSVDMHLAASIDLCKLKDHWRAIFDTDSPSAVYVESAIESMAIQCEALIGKWFTKGGECLLRLPPRACPADRRVSAAPPGFDQDKEHVIIWCFLDFMLILKRHQLETSPNDPLRLESCLAVSAKIVDTIEVVAANGSLAIMQDTASCMTSSLGVFLRKIFRRSGRAQKSLIISLFQRILVAHTRVSDGDGEAATAFVTRFIRRILGAIGSESRAASPKAPADGQDGSRNGSTDVFNVIDNNGNERDYFAELEEFLTMPETEAAGQSEMNITDEQYWAMLFSADPGNNFAGVMGSVER